MKQNIIRLDRWSPVAAKNEKKLSISGFTYGDPKRKDGTQVLTASIIEKSQPYITTSSGVTYELGEPDASLNIKSPGWQARFWAAKI